MTFVPVTEIGNAGGDIRFWELRSRGQEDQELEF